MNDLGQVWEGSVVLKVENISIASFSWGRKPMERKVVIPKSCVAREWEYLSCEPDVYTLQDFWEEALLLREGLEELAQSREE